MRRVTTVGVRELRQDASGVLRRVDVGERVVVTVRGRPVAELVPHSEARPTWRPVRERAALPHGVDDPHRDDDMALVDGATHDPFERGTHLLIAATAHAHGAALVTSDIGDVAGLEGILEVREP